MCAAGLASANPGTESAGLRRQWPPRPAAEGPSAIFQREQGYPATSGAPACTASDPSSAHAQRSSLPEGGVAGETLSLRLRAVLVGRQGTGFLGRRLAGPGHSSRLTAASRRVPESSAGVWGGKSPGAATGLSSAYCGRRGGAARPRLAGRPHRRPGPERTGPREPRCRRLSPPPPRSHGCPGVRFRCLFFDASEEMTLTFNS